jgi:hypothetical protein
MKHKKMKPMLSIGSYEPKYNNRFSIIIEDVNIPSFLFKKYMLYNVGKEFFIELELHELLNFTFNPSNIFSIQKVKIEHYDPVGDLATTISFDVESPNFKQICDYENGEPLINKITFKVNNYEIDNFFTDITNNVVDINRK